LDSTARLPDDAPSVEASTLLFRAGGRTFGAGIGAVREIIPFRPPTRLPGAPAHVLGLVNVRGTIVTVIDLARRVDPRGETPKLGSIVLVPSGGARLAGIAVDQVLDVVHVVPEQTLAGQVSDPTLEEVIVGLGHSDGQVVILLDVQALVKQVLV
jgi:purine-binding chemotaxis protein CheW